MSTIRCRSVLAAALMVLPVAAQEAPPQPIFSDRVEVNLVEVLVRVTDRDGRPVSGLGREDFKIFEDGEEVEITNFLAVEDRQVSMGRLEEGPRAAEATASSPPVATAETSVPLFLSVFVDNASLQHRNRKKVLASVQKFLREELGPEDRVMVATLGETYRIEQPYTRDIDAVFEVLEAAKKGATEGDAREATLRNLLRDIQGQIINLQTVAAHAQRTRFAIDQMARREQVRIRRVVSALTYLMSSQAGLPGQRVLLYLGEGLPTSPGEGALYAYYNKYNRAVGVEPPEMQALGYDMSREMEALSQHAQTVGVTFFAIDAAGKRAGLSTSAEMGLGERDSAGMSDFQRSWTQREEEIHIRNQQETIRLIAGDTGGEVMLNNRNYARFLADMRRDLDNFYSLGFQAPHAKQGDFHDIRVEVLREGLTVHHQRGYRDKTWTQRLTDSVVSDLLLEVGENPLDVRIEAGEPTIRDGKPEVEVSILVPLERLVLIPQGEELAASVSAVFMVKDPRGSTSSPHLLPMAVRLPPDWREQSAVRFAEARVPLRIDQGEFVLGVGIRDDLAEVISTSTLELTID